MIKKIEKIEKWFKDKNFRGLTKLCEDATKAQKNYGGSLKYKIDIALSKETQNKLKKIKI